MSDWNDGYVVDNEYVHSYFSVLAPGFLQYLLRLCGIDLPSRNEAEPLRYLELGYGQGLSLNVHAAAIQHIECWGTDFLAEQAANAQALSQQAGLGTHPLNYSFAELEEQVEKGALPAFDIIVMHGIWSWINDENRRHILNIIDKSLRPDGIVYVSYNALPGRIAITPVRDLIAIYADRKGAGKNSSARAAEAVRFVNTLSEAKATYFTEHPAVQSYVRHMKDLPASYLSHEYLNQNWRSFYLAEVAREMSAIGCHFVTSTKFLESFDLLQPGNTQDFLSTITDPIIKEGLRDFNLDTGFRQDIFARKSQPAISNENTSKLDNAFFAVLSPLEQITELELRLPHLQTTLDRAIFFPILEVLAENDYAPKNLDFMQTHPRLAPITPELLLFRINILVGANYIFPAEPSPSEKTIAACQRLNRVLCEKTAQGSVQPCVASPMLGSAISLSVFYQLFLLSYADGKKDPGSWARAAHATLSAQGKIAKAKSTKEAKKQFDGLLREARHFESVILPYLKAIGATLSPPV